MRQFFLKGVTTILKADFQYFINFLIFSSSSDSYFKLCLYNNGLKHDKNYACIMLDGDKV